MTQLSLFTRPWLDEAESLVLAHFPTGTQFSSDDVHQIVSRPEVDNWVGVLFARLRSKDLIKRVGSVVSKRPEANMRWIGVYEAK